MLIFDSLDDPKVVDQIWAGKVGVIPTDTVYGLVCSAANERAVESLYNLKSRDKKPGTLIAANIDQLVELGIPRRYMTAVESYWPNPISIETPHDISYLHQGTGRQALRIPKDDALQTFLAKTGPLQTTSANQPGEPTATTVDMAQKYFGDGVDFYVDGGDLSGRPPSTIIRVIDDAVDVIREGAVKINEKGEIENS